MMIIEITVIGQVSIVNEHSIVIEYMPPITWMISDSISVFKLNLPISRICFS